MSDNDAEIERLKQQLAGLQGDTVADLNTAVTTEHSVTGVAQSEAQAESHAPTGGHKCRAPPVNPFSGEDKTVRLDDWVPALHRAVTWNSWSEVDLLLQLAGHLQSRALHERELVSEDQKSTYCTAVDTLRERLDLGRRMLAVQNFCHAAQKGEEVVADFICRLE